MTATDEQTTRQRIIETARQLFLTRGFSGTGISAILKEAGVRSGSLYYFFKSKDELLVAVLERYRELLRPVLIDPVEQATDDPIERVFGLLENYRQFLLETGCKMGCPIGNLALEISDTHDDARERVRENFDAWCGCVEGWLIDAADRLPKDIDRAQLATFVLTVMEGAQMQAKATKTIEAYDASIVQLRRYFNALEESAT
jgi:TetR/AcrR family transcriptional regulator, transcriptional repressor for nem operon